jgi:hypothetical protein
LDNISVPLLAANTAVSSDGRYIVNRVLVTTGGSPPLALGNIPLLFGWAIGMELLLAQNSGGNAFSSIQSGAGSTNYLWSNTLPASVRPYSQSITGYKNVFVSLLTQ